jgi:hypothetical protein
MHPPCSTATTPQGAIRRLALKVRIDRLCRLARADMRGSPPKRRDETP